LFALRSIADELSKIRPQVYGAIYFHRITNGRFFGTDRAILSIFKLLCGEKFLDHAAVVTTRWDTITEEDFKRHQALNDALEADHLKLSDNSPGIFKRLRDDAGSSKGVLEYFVGLSASRPTPPQLQFIKEIGSRKQINVRSTSAGRFIIKRGSNIGETRCCVLL